MHALIAVLACFVVVAGLERETNTPLVVAERSKSTRVEVSMAKAATKSSMILQQHLQHRSEIAIA